MVSHYVLEDGFQWWVVVVVWQDRHHDIGGNLLLSDSNTSQLSSYDSPMQGNKGPAQLKENWPWTMTLAVTRMGWFGCELHGWS